ncbi:MAG: hypothetical protein IJB97_10180 [Clostridia bacterium]|nr:hypothetical protein [Clostridia bacterium]
MSTLLNRPNNTQSPDPATLHNSQIRERYRRLENAEADQFAQINAEQQQARLNAQPRAAVLTPERTDENRVAQAPNVTEFERRASDFSLFTPETLDRTLERSAAMEAPAQNVVEMPAQYIDTTPEMSVATAETTAEAVVEREEYGLTGRGKAVIGAFCGFVCAMLCVIGINSNIIAKNEAKLQALEATRQELLLEKAKIQADIDQITSEENVNRWAIENGWVKADN